MIQATKFAVDRRARLVLKDFGVSETEVLKRARLPLDLFSQENASLSADEYFRFWEALDRTVDDPAFPHKR